MRQEHNTRPYYMVLNKIETDKLELLAEMQQYNAGKALAAVNKKISAKKTAGWRITLQKIAATLLIPVMLGSISYVYYINHKVLPAKAAWQTIETLPGQKSIIELPDGTSVWLNSGTKLTYPLAFSRKSRNVKISGEAYFDVARMENKPFKVDLDGIEVNVLGTEFNINNYPTNENVHIFLNSGSIELNSISENSRRLLYIMNPGERAVYNKVENEFLIGEGQSEVCMAWMDGKLVFRNESMADVVKRLNRWFNIDIKIVDPSISDYTYTATFQHESLEQIMELLKISAPIDYKIIPRIKNDNYTFSKTMVELFTHKVSK